MSFVAVAVASIGAAGAIGGAVISSRGSSKAAETLATSAKSAAQLQAEAATKAGALGTEAAAKSNELLKAIYEGDLTKLQPYFDAGYEGLKQLTEGLKPGGYFTEEYPYFNFDISEVSKEPGYEFRRAQGEQALQRTAAAKGGLLGGKAVKEAVRYNQGFASNEVAASYGRQLGTYGTNLGKFQADRAARFDRLTALAGYGERATGEGINMGQTYGVRASQNIMEGARIGGNALTATAGARAEGETSAANARASGYVASGNIWGTAVNTMGRIGSDLVSTRTGTSKTAETPFYGAPAGTPSPSATIQDPSGKTWFWDGNKYVLAGG